MFRAAAGVTSIDQPRKRSWTESSVGSVAVEKARAKMLPCCADEIECHGLAGGRSVFPPAEEAAATDLVSAGKAVMSFWWFGRLVTFDEFALSITHCANTAFE